MSPPPKSPARNGYRHYAPSTSRPAARRSGSDDQQHARRRCPVGPNTANISSAVAGSQRPATHPSEDWKGRNQVSTTNRRIGAGLISVGWMGQLHTRAYRNVPIVYPELGIKPELVIAADTAPDRVEFARDVLGYSRGTTDYREVLADPEVEVVSICAPNFLHAEIGVAAAEAGKHFWIEKPVGRSLEETARIEAAATRAGVITSIGYNYRHAPAVEHARALIAAGRLGRITNVRAAFFSGYANEPRGALSWRFNRELAGSGVLADLFSHASDLCQYVVGPIAELTALTSTVYTERPKLAMGSGTHFDVIEGGEMGPVENEDYAAALVRWAPLRRHG